MGHVTGIASATETVTNIDTKVTQQLYTGDGIMPLLFAKEQRGYPENITNIVYRNDSICARPSDGYIFANRFIGKFEGTLYGSAAVAHQLEPNVSVGNETQPVYFKQGVPFAISYTINKTAPSSSSDDSTVPTSKAVWTAVSNGIATANAMIYRGTISGGSTDAYGALTPFANKGWTYKVSTAGKINGKAVEIGDMLICNTDGTSAATSSNYSTIADNWDIIQSNIDGAVTGPSSSTNAHVAVFDGSTGKVIKDSGFTIGTSVPSNAAFTDTDMKVRQSLTSSNSNRPLLMAYQQNTATSTVDNVVFRNNSIYANPSTGTITANKFIGSATHAETSSQSGFVGVGSATLSHYWVKLWEYSLQDYNNEYYPDVTFLLQNSYTHMQGILHIDLIATYDTSRFFCKARLTSGNIPKSIIRLYYNGSAKNCQLWVNVGGPYGAMNAKILHKTLRKGEEIQTAGTMYSTYANTVQELPGSGSVFTLKYCVLLIFAIFSRP